MAAALHRIRRQRWTVKAGSAGEAFALRQHLRSLWPEALRPAFERAFDEAASGAHVIHLPKLELSIRLASPAQVAEELPALIYQQMREHLRAALAVPPAAPASGRPSADAADPFDSLLRYLQTGSLPWPAIRESSPDVTSTLQEDCRQYRPRLLEHLRTHDEPADFHFRLLQLLPAAEALEWVKAATEGINPDWRQDLLQVLVVLLDHRPAFLNRYAQLRLVGALLNAGSTPSQSAPTAPLAGIPEAVLAAAENGAFQEWLRSLSAGAARLFQPGAEAATPSPADARLGDADKPGAATGTVRTSAPPLVDRPGIIPPAPPSMPSPAAPSLTARDGGDAEFATLVHEAGLILLHPYLPRFLAAINLSIGNGFPPQRQPDQPSEHGNPSGRTSGAADPIGQEPLTSRDAARAAAALHFLATGKTELFEHELGFLKVLLGWRPEQPLLVAAGLLEPETLAEANALLQSVIGHWTALKNTSITGLRESFLNRPGLLRETVSGWKLQVERRPYDVLLDHLPWTFRVAKLPWMPLPLFTEW